MSPKRSVATADERRIYVEQVGGGWRWSLTHPGGGYPLVRVTARFLRADYRGLAVGFRTVTEGVCVLCADPNATTIPDRWAVIDLDEPTTAKVVEELIVHAFS
jgi:hypothetical protein